MSITEKEFKSKLTSLETEGRFFNPLGQEIAWDLCRTDGLHRLLLGGTGWGKTFIVQTVMEILGKNVVAVNAHPGMDIRDLVGQWRPEALEAGGVTIRWEDGTFTDAVRKGMTFMLEEATRAPQEFMSRMYGVMDSAGAYWSLPENGEASVPIGDGFSVVATANPPGKGYLAQNLDKAFLRRFKWVRNIDEPLADEEKTLRYILGDGVEAVDRAKRFYTWVDDAREAADTNINTGDLAAVAEMTMRGFTPMQAIEFTVTPKYAGSASALLTGGRAHFGNTASNKVLMGNSGMFPNNSTTAPAPMPQAAAPNANVAAATIAGMSTDEILAAISGIKPAE